MATKTSGRPTPLRIIIAFGLLAIFSAVVAIAVNLFSSRLGFKNTTEITAAVAVAISAIIGTFVQSGQGRAEQWRRTVADLVKRWPLPSLVTANPSDFGARAPSRRRQAIGKKSYYIARDIDRQLDRALAAQPFVIVTGKAGAGKTRSSFEAARRQLPGYKLIVPRDGAAVGKLATLIPSQYERTPLLVWLDELESYLTSEDLNAAAIIDQWSKSIDKIKVLATIRSAELERIQSIDDKRRDSIRGALERATFIHLPTALTSNEAQAGSEAFAVGTSIWSRCTAPVECNGAGSYANGRCLAHLNAVELEEALKNITDQRAIDARGVRFSPMLLRSLIDILPKNVDGGAVFRGVAWFGSAIFEPESNSLGGSTSLQAVTFEGKADFRGVGFHAPVSFVDASFLDGADFSNAIFYNNATFAGARFVDSVDFTQAQFSAGADFDSATLPEASSFSAIVVDGDELTLDRVSFPRFIDIEIRARRVSCLSTQFLGGGHFRIEEAEVTLEQAEFPTPFIISGARPLLFSLRQANLTGLVLTGGSLQRCYFADSHNLDHLRFEARHAFHRAPSRWRAGRLVLAEEVRWRQARRPGTSWDQIDVIYPGWVGDMPAALEPEQIAAIYRGLRKGREDNKDEPGAADFYYGEMEMRRTSGSSPPVERLILTLYWLLSGYALRAWRAVAGLVVILVVFAWMFSSLGFDRSKSTASGTSDAAATAGVTTTTAPTTSTTRPLDQSFRGGLVYSGRTAIGLARDPAGQLTATGEILQIVNRILLPILLGLAILSIRGRVKR